MMQTLLLASGVPFLRGAKLRTCLAMLGGNVVANLLPPLSFPENSWVLLAYVMLDLVSAFIITRHPAGNIQRAIGLIFAVMVLFHLGLAVRIMLHYPTPNPMLYWQTVFYSGWVQVCLLCSWGLNDGLIQPLVNRYWRGRFAVPNRALAR